MTQRFWLGRQRLVYRLALQLSEWSIEEGFGLWVHDEDLPLLIDDAQPVSERVQDRFELVPFLRAVCLAGATEFFVQSLHFPRRHIERLFQQRSALVSLGVALTDSLKHRLPDPFVNRAARGIEHQTFELSLQEWVHRRSQAASEMVVNVIV